MLAQVPRRRIIRVHASSLRAGVHASQLQKSEVAKEEQSEVAGLLLLGGKWVASEPR